MQDDGCAEGKFQADFAACLTSMEAKRGPVCNLHKGGVVMWKLEA